MLDERLLDRHSDAGKQQAREEKLKAPNEPGTDASSAPRQLLLLLWLIIGKAGIRGASSLSPPAAVEQKALQSEQG